MPVRHHIRTTTSSSTSELWGEPTFRQDDVVITCNFLFYRFNVVRVIDVNLMLRRWALTDQKEGLDHHLKIALKLSVATWQENRWLTGISFEDKDWLKGRLSWVMAFKLRWGTGVGRRAGYMSYVSR